MAFNYSRGKKSSGIVGVLLAVLSVVRLTTACNRTSSSSYSGVPVTFASTDAATLAEATFGVSFSASESTCIRVAPSSSVTSGSAFDDCLEDKTKLAIFAGISGDTMANACYEAEVLKRVTFTEIFAFGEDENNAKAQMVVDSIEAGKKVCGVATDTAGSTVSTQAAASSSVSTVVHAP